MVNLFTQTPISTAKDKTNVQFINPLSINQLTDQLISKPIYTRPQMQVTKEGERQRITSQSH